MCYKDGVRELVDVGAVRQMEKYRIVELVIEKRGDVRLAYTPIA
jgi:hypothetical protein